MITETSGGLTVDEAAARYRNELLHAELRLLDRYLAEMIAQRETCADEDRWYYQAEAAKTRKRLRDLRGIKAVA